MKPNDTDTKSSHAPTDRAVALEKIAREEGPYFYRRALYLAKSADPARDLMQDTFERALRDRGAIVPPEKLRGWLLVIMRNLFIDRQRHDKRQRRWVCHDVCLETIPAPIPDPAPRWQAVSVSEVETSVQALDERFRSVYELHVFGGLGYDEIAARLGVRPATVGTRLHRARHLLRARLDREAQAA